MTITYPLTAPATPYPRSVIPQLQFVVSGNESPFTKQGQFYKWQGEQWAIDVQLPPMTRAEAEEWITFAMELRGRYGTFLYGVQDGYEPRGEATGTPLVVGGGQTGYMLDIDGGDPNITGQYLKGDYFQIGTGSDSRIHKVTRNIDTDLYGEATLYFQPSLRSSPANDAPLVFENPVGIWRMASNTVSWNVEIGMEYGFSFRAIEALG